MSDRPGDDFLRAAGIGLPCAESFGWPGWGEDARPVMANCDRPYGHTGPHMAEGFHLAGARHPRDDERTNAVLRQIAERPTRPDGITITDPEGHSVTIGKAEHFVE